MKTAYKMDYGDNLYTLKEAEQILNRGKARQRERSCYFAKQKLAGALLIMIAVFVLVAYPDAALGAIILGLIGSGLVFTKKMVMTLSGWEELRDD